MLQSFLLFETCCFLIRFSTLGMSTEINLQHISYELFDQFISDFKNYNLSAMIYQYLPERHFFDTID